MMSTVTNAIYHRVWSLNESTRNVYSQGPWLLEKKLGSHDAPRN